MIKNSYTKKDIISYTSSKTGFSKRFCEKLVNEITKIIAVKIKKNNFTLKNIGSLKKVFKKQRLGRNPKTKEEFIITSRYSIKFAPSKNLISKLN
tara:strand:+ start:630 stop:914 length:285 start_codon:yes stop_codon:yes gene_type:complete